MGEYDLDYYDLEQGPVAGFWEHSNDPLIWIEKFLE
jgi:hypothetical protein